MAITLISFSNPQWANAEHTVVEGNVQWSVMDEPSYSGIVLTENYPHIQDLKTKLENGEFGVIADYVPPTQDELNTQAANAVREVRNNLLTTIVDPVVSNPLRWNSMTAEEQSAMVTYRQALLDIPEQDGFPTNVVFPEL